MTSKISFFRTYRLMRISGLRVPWVLAILAIFEQAWSHLSLWLFPGQLRVEALWSLGLSAWLTGPLALAWLANPKASIRGQLSFLGRNLAALVQLNILIGAPILLPIAASYLAQTMGLDLLRTPQLLGPLILIMCAAFLFSCRLVLGVAVLVREEGTALSAVRQSLSLTRGKVLRILLFFIPVLILPAHAGALGESLPARLASVPLVVVGTLLSWCYIDAIFRQCVAGESANPAPAL